MSARCFELKYHLVKPDIEIMMSGLGRSSLLKYSKSNLDHQKSVFKNCCITILSKHVWLVDFRG